MDTEASKNTLDWNKDSHDFGDMRIGQTKSTVFVYNGNKEIKSFDSSCFCLSLRKTVYLDRTEVIVFWKVKPTPKINVKSKKTITVIFDDEEKTLTLTGTIRT